MPILDSTVVAFGHILDFVAFGTATSQPLSWPQPIGLVIDKRLERYGSDEVWVRSQKFVVDHLVSFVKIRDGMMIPLLGAEFPKRGIEDTCKKGRCVHTGMHTLAPRLSCWRTDQHPSAKMNGFPAQGMKTVQKKAEKWAEYTTRELQKEADIIIRYEMLLRKQY